MALLTTGRYVVGSALLTALVVWQAFVTREQYVDRADACAAQRDARRPLTRAHLPSGWRRFYPAVVFLSTSKICLAIFGNMGFAMSLVSYKLITLVRGVLGGRAGRGCVAMLVERRAWDQCDASGAGLENSPMHSTPSHVFTWLNASARADFSWIAPGFRGAARE